MAEWWFAYVADRNGCLTWPSLNERILAKRIPNIAFSDSEPISNHFYFVTNTSESNNACLSTLSLVFMYLFLTQGSFPPQSVLSYGKEFFWDSDDPYERLRLDGREDLYDYYTKTRL